MRFRFFLHLIHSRCGSDLFSSIIAKGSKVDQKVLSVRLFEFEKVCAFIFVFGLLGNGLTLWILVQSKKWKKNTTNMFIVSLTTVQDFDSTFKKYFAQSEVQILNIEILRGSPFLIHLRRVLF